MVILYGHMSRCDRIPPQIAIEDVWMALDMLPSFRWRWERKDLNPGHPLIAKLAEKVLDVNLHQVAPSGAPMLLSEQDWDGEHIIMSPKQGGNQHPPGRSPTTPKMGPAQYGAPIQPFGSHPPVQVKGSPGSHNGDTNGVPPKMPEVPPYYFYPIYGPENGTAAGGQVPNINAFGYQSDQDQYMLEEKDMTISPTVNAAMQMQGWQPNGVSAQSEPTGLISTMWQHVLKSLRQQRPPPNQQSPPQFGPQPQA